MSTIQSVLKGIKPVRLFVMVCFLPIVGIAAYVSYWTQVEWIASLRVESDIACHIIPLSVDALMMVAFGQNYLDRNKGWKKRIYTQIGMYSGLLVSATSNVAHVLEANKTGLILVFAIAISAWPVYALFMGIEIISRGFRQAVSQAKPAQSQSEPRSLPTPTPVPPKPVKAPATRVRASRAKTATATGNATP